MLPKRFFRVFFSRMEDAAVTTKVRCTYLSLCKQKGIAPSVSFLNQFRECMQKEVALQRISITHGNYGDGQIAPVIAALKLSPSITDLALNYIDLTDSGCTELLTFLSRHRSVTSLELFGNRIGNPSCSLVPSLLGLQALTRLKLGDNSITAAGARCIAEGLAEQHSLIQLHLGGNNIGDDGLIAIVKALWNNTTLTSLGIRDNGIGASGINALVQLLCLPKCVLSEVQLKGNAIGDEGAEYLAQAMAMNRTMRVLEVQANGVGPRGAAVLCNALHNNMTVHAINFNDNALNDEGAEAVAALLMNNSSITTVGISGNSIEKRGTSAIAKALACNTSLTGIDLGNNRLGNAGVILLANVLRDQNQSLMSLDVHMNNVNLQGYFALTQALLVNTSLKHLDCGSNYARNQGAHAWAKVLRKSTTLTRLCLTDNEIGREGGESLLQAMKFNAALRNFQFGGQSQVHPLANRIAPVSRRAINNIISRNKRVWKGTQGPAPTPLRDLPWTPESTPKGFEVGEQDSWSPQKSDSWKYTAGRRGEPAHDGRTDWRNWDHGNASGGEYRDAVRTDPTSSGHWDVPTGQPVQPAAHQATPISPHTEEMDRLHGLTGREHSRLSYYVPGTQAFHTPDSGWQEPVFEQCAADDHPDDTGEVFCYSGANSLAAATQRGAPCAWGLTADAREAIGRSWSTNLSGTRHDGVKSAASSPQSANQSSVGSAEGEDSVASPQPGLTPALHTQPPAWSAALATKNPGMSGTPRFAQEYSPTELGVAAHPSDSNLSHPRPPSAPPPRWHGGISVSSPPPMDESTLRAVMSALKSFGTEEAKDAGALPPHILNCALQA